MAKDARLPMRVPEALKVEFEWAAEQDGCRGVSTWLRQLGEERAEWLRERESVGGTPLPRSEAAKVAAREAIKEATTRSEPAVTFVPGFGLDEED